MALIGGVFFVLLQLVGFKAGTGITGGIAGGCAAMLLHFFWPEDDEEEQEEE